MCVHVCMRARVSQVCKRRFRSDGNVVGKVDSIFSDTGMRAVDKAALLFMLSHVIGPAPDEIIPPRFYMPLATAVATAQLILIAGRGRRSYTEDEFEHIFDKGYVLLFGALESVRQEMYHNDLKKWAESVSAPPPKRFKRASRLTLSLLALIRNSLLALICKPLIAMI